MNVTRLLGCVAVVAGTTLATAAHAALTATGVPCNGHGTAMPSQPGYLDCSGSWLGNNLNQEPDVLTQIQTDFGLVMMTSFGDVTEGNNTPSGTLTFALQSGPFVLALKAGNAFSLFEFASGISSVHYDTLGVGFTTPSGNVQFGQDLSHASLYSFASPVSEPETAALILTGLVAVFFMARRRRA
jgi:hypothetical protein